MKIFTCVDHDYHYPIGVASVVVAENEEQAKDLLDNQLREHGLRESEEEPYTLKEISAETHRAYILRDGNY